MNPLTAVLCTSAICFSLEEQWGWVRPILLAAFCLAIYQNLVTAKALEKILKK